MNPRLTALAASTLSVFAMSTGIAAAKGGGGTPAPAPAPAPVIDCFSDTDVAALTAPDTALNAVGDAGCVGINAGGAGLSLRFVVVNPGWTYDVLSNGGGTNSRVQIKFTQTGTGRSIDFRYELGKTRIG